MHKNYDEGSGELAIVLSMKIEQKLSEYFNMTGIEVKHLKNFEINLLFWREFELNFRYMKWPRLSKWKYTVYS